MRTQLSVKIRIVSETKIVTIECLKNESILEALDRQGYYLSAACGGNGSCGKCSVQVIEGNLSISTQDKTMFTDHELTIGNRLACKAYPTEDCTIKLSSREELDFEVVNEFMIDNKETKDKETKDKETKDKETKDKEIKDKEIKDKETKDIEINDIEAMDIIEDMYVIGIDLGTTTLVTNLVNLTNKNIIQSYSSLNKQRSYGADVISRIKASNEGKNELLRDSIRKDLLEGIQSVMEGAKLPKNLVLKIAIAGNTTMGHILMGYSCNTLGIFPYTPINIDTIKIPFHELFASNYLDIPVTLLPGISTYVGGDIVAGLLACNFDRIEKPCILIDLGTNGEMAIGNKDKILVSSTAAGPAFEGGNISCGVGSIAGAISHIIIEDNHISYQTIGGKEPVGICGTGVIEITSELLKEGVIDETGLLNDNYFEDGYEVAKDGNGNRIIFTQKDIREIQLAKSAIRTGVEVLIKRYGVSYEELDTVYLAGGFGFKIDIDKAIHIGLLPKELHGKIKAIGNSSLAGAIEYLVNQEAKDKIAAICQVSKEINLSNEMDFNELYIENISF